MNMANKIFGITTKIIVGIFVFYLFLSLIVVPLVSPWLIRSQASNLLGHNVKVRSVQFNPFLWRLTIKGLEISGTDNQVMVGFDKFWCDVSFISLLKKLYRVESLGLDGLKVNVVLSDKGNINLLDLMPKGTSKPSETQNGPQETQPAEQKVNSTTPADATVTKPLPSMVIDLISMHNGSIRFVDQSINPNFVTSLDDINLRVTNLSTKPDVEAKVSFQAKLDDKGIVSAETVIKPFASLLAFETVFKLNNYALQVLTPYIGKYTGRTVKDGKLNLNMDYRLADNKLKASHKLLVQSFDFGDKVESKDALNLPFGLALALLEDSQNRIDISLPVTGDISKPNFHYSYLIGQVLRNFFFKIVTKPFTFLGSMIGIEGGSEELGYIRFLPGKTDLSDAEKEKLNTMVKALKERPKLSLKVKGSYDPVMDWRAIKTDVFNKDLWVLKEESRRPESWVYQELYQRRFGIRALWKLTKSHRSKEGVYDNVKINKEISRQLIEEGAPNKVALKALAEGRAKVIYDFIIAAGFDAKRASIGSTRESQGSAGFVPLELALTVFDNSPTASTGSLFPADVKE